MDPLKRFFEYAMAFEEFYISDDWSLIESYFAEDAVYEIVGEGAIAALNEGRPAIRAYFDSVLNSFDRRFDRRQVELISDPQIRDGKVWFEWKGTYTREGLPDLVIEGTETALLEDDRIVRLEDRYEPEQAANMLAYFAAHDAKLKPIAG